MANGRGTNPLVDVEEWLEDDNLMLLECWSRDGYTFQDIANRIGITTKTLSRWREEYDDIDKALKQGREIIDYKVENALLKSALGYKTKEVTVITTLRNGKMVEETKQTVTREQAPNVSAIQTWLYNRCRDKWRNMNSRSNFLDEITEDSNVSIVITRAGKDAAQVKTQIETDESLDDDESWGDEINESVTVRGMTQEEKEEQKKIKKLEAKQRSSKKTDQLEKKSQTKVEVEPEDEWDEVIKEVESWED